MVRFQQGLAKNSNFLLNIANLIHDPNEVLSLELDKIKYGLVIYNRKIPLK